MASTAVARRIRGGRTRVLPERRRFTVDEYDRMIRAGIIQSGERVELIEGEILCMAAMGAQHAGTVRFLSTWFVRVLGDRVIVSTQCPVRLRPGSEPEPDVALLRPRADNYRTGHPGPEDVLLVIEISDTTIRFDRDRKLPMYAAAGIPETWIVDLRQDQVLVYREPRGGTYQQILTVTRDGLLSPLAFPELSLPMAQVVGRHS